MDPIPELDLALRRGGDMAAWLLSHPSVKPDLVLPQMGSPMHGAATLGDAAMLRQLLARGGDPSARAVNSGERPRVKLGQTPLHVLSSLSWDQPPLEALEVLLGAGAAVNALDAAGQTPLDVVGFRAVRARLRAAGALGEGDRRSRGLMERVPGTGTRLATLISNWLRDRRGGHYRLDAMAGRVWVASSLGGHQGAVRRAAGHHGELRRVAGAHGVRRPVDARGALAGLRVQSVRARSRAGRGALHRVARGPGGRALRGRALAVLPVRRPRSRGVGASPPQRADRARRRCRPRRARARRVAAPRRHRARDRLRRGGPAHGRPVRGARARHAPGRAPQRATRTRAAQDRAHRRAGPAGGRRARGVASEHGRALRAHAAADGCGGRAGPRRAARARDRGGGAAVGRPLQNTRCTATRARSPARGRPWRRC